MRIIEPSKPLNNAQIGGPLIRRSGEKGNLDGGSTPPTSTKSGFAILHGSSVGLYLGIDFQVLETAFDGGVLVSTGAQYRSGESSSADAKQSNLK